MEPLLPDCLYTTVEVLGREDASIPLQQQQKGQEEKEEEEEAKQLSQQQQAGEHTQVLDGLMVNVSRVAASAPLPSSSSQVGVAADAATGAEPHQSSSGSNSGSSSDEDDEGEPPPQQEHRALQQQLDEQLVTDPGSVRQRLRDLHRSKGKEGLVDAVSRFACLFWRHNSTDELLQHIPEVRVLWVCKHASMCIEQTQTEACLVNH
jgi:hypothetical protein